MVETDAQGHPSKRNNVEQSSAQSTADGPDTLHGDPVRRAAEVESQPVSDIVLNHHQNTTADHVQVNERKRRNVTSILVPSMVYIQRGPNGHLAVLRAMAEPRPETGSVHHPNMEAKDAQCLEMQWIHENAVPTLAH